MKDCIRQCCDMKIIFVIKCRHSDLKGNAIYLKPPLLLPGSDRHRYQIILRWSLHLHTIYIYPNKYRYNSSVLERQYIQSYIPFFPFFLWSLRAPINFIMQLKPICGGSRVNAWKMISYLYLTGPTSKKKKRVINKTKIDKDVKILIIEQIKQF